MEKTTKAEAMDAIQWFYSIELGDGHITPGYKSSEILTSEADLFFKNDVQGKKRFGHRILGRLLFLPGRAPQRKVSSVN